MLSSGKATLTTEIIDKKKYVKKVGSYGNIFIHEKKIGDQTALIRSFIEHLTTQGTGKIPRVQVYAENKEIKDRYSLIFRNEKENHVRDFKESGLFGTVHQQRSISKSNGANKPESGILLIFDNIDPRRFLTQKNKDITDILFNGKWINIGLIIISQTPMHRTVPPLFRNNFDVIYDGSTLNYTMDD